MIDTFRYCENILFIGLTIYRRLIFSPQFGIGTIQKLSLNKPNKGILFFIYFFTIDAGGKVWKEISVAK